ncbi:hypothetical protein J5F27_14215, partial [Schleiferilactobacillus harbinensis]|uniref:hypothetical protein n=1 Tax=Schleiferilactobacillus harbinensis TaxID=304207 RepID=UPI001AAF784D
QKSKSLTTPIYLFIIVVNQSKSSVNDENRKVAKPRLYRKLTPAESEVARRRENGLRSVHRTFG